MPIRFRCTYCNQLLGIARRKIGSVVRCPTCAGQVVVPEKSTVGVGDEAAPDSPFEGDDFDELLEMPPVQKGSSAKAVGAGAAPSKAASPEGAWGTHGEPAFDLEKLYPSGVTTKEKEAKAKLTGITLSPFLATVLTVAVIFLLAIAFGIGVLVGRFLLEQ